MANKFLKQAEGAIRNILYALIHIFLRNKKITEKINPETIKKVLVIRYDVIGDLVVTLPMIKFIKQLIPHASIHLLASERNSKLAEFDRNIDKIHLFDGRIIKSFIKLYKLRKEKYDIIFSAFYTLVTRNGIICNIIGGREAIKVNIWQDERRYVFFNYQSKIAAEKLSMYEKMYYMVADTIAGGENFNIIEPYLFIPDASRNRCFEKLQNLGLESKKIIAINLSAGRKLNEWHIDNYVKLINSLLNTPIHYDLLIFYHKKDLDKCNYIISKSNESKKKIFVYPPTDDILEIASLIEQSALLVTPDTGTVHICSATKTPLVVMYNEEYTYRLWHPYGVVHRALISKSKDKMIISPESVYENTMELLKELNERKTIQKMY